MGYFSSPDAVAHFETAYHSGTIRYGDMKKQLAEDMALFIKPIREKAADIQNNKPLLQKIIRQGADKARTSADQTLQLVRSAIGMNYG